MRHGKKFNHLSRKKGHRRALLSNMAMSLIKHKRINTTVAKAKALRVYVEPLITKAKNDTTHSRRTVFSYLQDKESVTELFGEVIAKIGNRPGGYTRILKTGNRLGDNAEMCLIELVDYNDNLLKDAKPKAKTTRRGKKKATTESEAIETPKAKTTEKKVEAKEEKKEVKKEAPKKEEVKETPKAEKKEKTEEPKAKKEEKPDTGKDSKTEE